MEKIIRKISFIGLSIAMFMGILDSTIVNIALPSIMNHFNANLTDTSWIVTTYVLALAIFTVTSAKLADQYGRKKLMLLGLTLFGGFSAACMFAPSLFWLSVFRFVQGVGGAIITPVVLPMGIEIFGKEKLPLITSAVGAISALAAASGPPLGGVILRYFSWHWIFGLNVPLALSSFLLISVLVKETRDETSSKKIDWLGILSLSLALFGITFGLLKGRDYGWSSLVISGSLLCGAIMIIVFILIEKRISTPMIDLKLFKIFPFTASCLVYFIIAIALICPSLIMNYFLQNVLNYSALSAALVIAPVSLTVAVAMPLGTKLAAKVGAAAVNFSGMLIVGLSLLLLALIKTNTPKIIMIIFLIVHGLGFGFANQSIVSAIKPLPKNKSGLGSGIVNTGRQLGMCLGIAILVTILNVHLDNAKQNVKTDALQTISRKTLSPDVKRTASNQVRRVFRQKEQTNSKSGKKQMQELRRNIKEAATKTERLPRPVENEYLKKMYDGSHKLSQSSEQVAERINELSRIRQTNDVKTTSSMVNAQHHITSAVSEISAGQAKITQSIALVAQTEELKETLRHIEHTKNTKITEAFSKTYIFAAAFVLFCSPIALWSEKKLR